MARVATPASEEDACHNVNMKASFGSTSLDGILSGANLKPMKLAVRFGKASPFLFGFSPKARRRPRSRWAVTE
jgi:hypothetical protein